MGKLVLKSKKTLDVMEERKGGGRADFFKPTPNDKGVFKVFVCPPKSEEVPMIQKVVVHEIFRNRSRLGGVVSPANFEEKDPFIKIGWSLRNKYEKSKKKELKEFFRNMVGSTKSFLYVIDPSNVEAGIQLWQAPKPVIDAIIGAMEAADGDIDFAHPETGRALVVKKTGERLNTKYTCGWATKDIELDGIDEDKLVEMLEALPDSLLGSVFKKPTQSQIDDFKEVIDGLAEEAGITINWKNGKDSGVDEDEDDEGEDEDLDDEDEDLDDEEEVKPPKKTSKSSKPSKKKVEVEEDEDEDLDLEDEDEDFEDEEEVKPPKKTSKSSKPSKKKVIDDEDDDLDLDEE
jgi:hypothetical protein